MSPQPPHPAANWLKAFRPAPQVVPATADQQEIQRQYRLWQRRVLVSSIIGYALFYFVRKNLPIAMPALEKDLGITKPQLGLFLTLHGVLYGVSKFANGFLADRANARVFMATGLAASAILNIAFGLNSTVVALGTIWMLNGWFQGMGFPPCARLLTHWFPPKKLATRMAIWNTSHQAGGGMILILCGYLVLWHWRACFLVPAALAFAGVLLLWLTLPDTPPSVGLPEVEGTTEKADDDFAAFLMRKVFRNKFIWLISAANFFVYILRYAVFDWGPTLLTQAKHLSITNAGWMVAGFEFFGLIGALFGGWLAQRCFGGRAMRAGVFFMMLALLAMLLFWKAAGESKLWNTSLLCAMGFFIYGPQLLIGVAAANLATRRAAATGVGLTGLFGYASTVLSGWGFGALVDHWGWERGFQALLLAAGIGTALFIAAWNAKADGYEEGH